MELIAALVFVQWLWATVTGQWDVFAYLIFADVAVAGLVAGYWNQGWPAVRALVVCYLAVGAFGFVFAGVMSVIF